MTCNACKKHRENIRAAIRKGDVRSSVDAASKAVIALGAHTSKRILGRHVKK